MSSLAEQRARVEAYLAALPFADELGGLTEAMRYSLDGGGKRVRPVLCLATGEALGAEPEQLLPAAAAIELVHTFGMVHDDLPALDDDAVRRGRPTSHVEFDEATAILNGDALLAQAFELALSYPGPEVARELSRAALGMIGGQFDDIRGEGDLARRHSLKTGRLFEAAVGCALAVAETPESERGAVARLRVGVRPPLPGRGRPARRRRARRRARGATRPMSWPTRSRAVPARSWTRFRRTRPFWTSFFRA